jgi:putative ABC transport system permease protein
MREAIAQSFENLRANKLRSFLTMFGILWGVIAVVVLTATGEGFQRGNQTVLEELGKNIAIVWGGRTTLQAGGERAGRQIFLTLDDARAIAAQSPLAAVVSPEINRAASRSRAASCRGSGTASSRNTRTSAPRRRARAGLRLARREEVRA